MPNYLSFNEARFILQTAGLDLLKKMNQGGPKARELRDQLRKTMSKTRTP